MVRLRQALGFAQFPSGDDFRFPFHNGSIETSNTKSPGRFSYALISIPQWFDWDFLLPNQHLLFLVYFHSTMVRLRQETRLVEAHSQNHNSYFHSTMVRLRRFCVNSQMTFCESYFHSTMVRLRLRRESWYISRYTRQFPFHHGSIETTVTLRRLRKLRYISIPQWFDWDGASRSCFSKSSTEDNFHSTMVRLRLHLIPKQALLWYYFHSTMVRLRLFW